MAKRLTMAEIDAILTLHTTGHSNREIATLLGSEPGDGRQVRWPGRGPEPAKRAHRDGCRWRRSGRRRFGEPAKRAHRLGRPSAERAAQQLRAVPGGDPGEGRAGLGGGSHPPGPGGSTRRGRPQLLQRAAVRRPAEAQDAAAVSADGDRAGRGGPGGLRHRRAGPHGRREGPPSLGLPHRAELQPQGVQRGRVAAVHGILHRVPGERLPSFRRRAQAAGDRQPQGGRGPRPTGTIPRSIPSCNRSRGTTARCSCPPSRTRRVTRARSKAA